MTSILLTDKLLPTVETGRKRQVMEVKYPEFGAAVDAAIAQLGYTNNQVADLMTVAGAGVKGEMVRRYRNGFQLPDAARLDALAAALGKTPVELRFPDQAGKSVVNRAEDLTGVRYPVRRFVQEVIQAEREGDLPDDLIEAMQKILGVALQLKRALNRSDSDEDLDRVKKLSG
ncbi:hypothetical protein [Paraburkholderia sediminicola]|uniref:hypothetical protein n=1 Tax=Paraburkholderia sediminicola TaxID=458836 RepID=UPI0038BD6C03